jgi:hypothetical protein
MVLKCCCLPTCLGNCIYFPSTHNISHLRKEKIDHNIIMARPSTLQAIALLATTYITYRLIKALITGRRFRAFAKQQGCEEPLDDSGSFPYGWRTIHRMMCVPH